MPAQMLRLLCLALCLMTGSFGARADDEPLADRIAAMDAPQLGDLISQSLLGIANDTRRLRDFANSKSCTDLCGRSFGTQRQCSGRNGSVYLSMAACRRPEQSYYCQSCGQPRRNHHLYCYRE